MNHEEPTDQLGHPGARISGVAVREGRVPGAEAAASIRKFTDVEDQGELDDRQKKQRQQAAGEDEVHHGRASFPGRHHRLLPGPVHRLVEQFLERRPRECQQGRHEDG